MALMITEDCISCNACIGECPTNAIYEESDIIFKIDPKLCTECVGYYAEPQCVYECIVDAIVQNPDYVESREELIAKKEQVDVW